ncbi:zinc-binding dehydrogenase [Colletotrichum gloeosporioides Cg-14]|uniref:Zinc-binding dehydrogenase n=1 Tax=Colletotrichum gloeosporioides (strain Cg-14) TaxID=1237896 RepID=T0KQU9_COLGC|nr:zinc-binding dehydrogenase [Colletotrichum gloeosporioides Cg-14]
MPTFSVFKGCPDGFPKKATVDHSDQLEGDDVLVRVTASGLCGTDLHYKKADMVLGHEGVGVISDIGPAVRHLKKGERVGWGYATNSCGYCQICLQGDDIYCTDRAIYGNSNTDQGSFASHAIWREAFLHRIPDALSDEHAAPLQCAGATVFTTLYNVEPNETVGIVGVGGLGHLAIQFAAKLGCRVVVLSGSENKKEEVLKLGAHEFIGMRNRDPSSATPSWPIDRLIVTTSSQPDWDALLPLMATRSKIYPISVSAGNLEIPYMPLILNGISVRGSLVASRKVHRRMLEFAAQHDVKPVIEVFPMSENGIRQAFEKLESGNVQFRAVLRV